MNKTLFQIVFLFFAACFFLETLFAAEKSRYDIVGGVSARPGSLPTTSSMPEPGWKITQTYGEATVVPGCYYTIGTVHSLSGTLLDSSTTITYGHPFARTSYPIFHIDGTWGKPEDLLPADPVAVQVTVDSIAVSYLTAAHLRATFCLRFGGEGRQVGLIARIANEDSIAHSLGCGFAFDPSLGNRGDGVFSIDGKAFPRDTVIGESGLQGSSWLVTERSSGKKGMRIGLQFPSGVPATFLVANWRDLLGSETTVPTFPAARGIYDLMLKMHWTPETVQPGTVISRTVETDLLAPDFGSGLFMRWDLPGFVSLDDGIMFPRDFTSWVTLANLSAVAKSGISIKIIPSFPVQTLVEPRTADIGGNGYQYVSFPVAVNEVYEDQVAMMTVVCDDGGIPVDSLVRPFFIPATPVSDTGLTVTIDSLITSAFPEVSVIFEAQRTATQQKVYNISPENVFLYENTIRISGFTLGKEVGEDGGQADIVFVLDVTGSMENEITAVKNNILEFADSLVMRGVDFRLGMVTFLDAIENVYDFTNDALQFKNTVGLQNAHAGGDGPENSLDALYRASQMQFREAANKIFIWITDAGFHEKDWATTRDRQEVLDRLLSMDITVNAIGAPEYQTDFYNPMVQPTGGQYYDISGNFRDILLDIGRLHGIGKYRLTYQAPTGSTGTREVTLTLHLAGLGGTASIGYGGASGASGAPLLCYPNPFNPLLRIRFSLGDASHGTLTLFDVLGRQIRLFTLSQGGSEGEIVWDARNDRGQDVGTGIYFVRLTRYGPDTRTLGSTLAKVLHLK